MDLADILYYAVLFALGAVAGFMNVLAGGGSTLILPALIFAGMDSALANGTNRVAILLQNIAAVRSFQVREHAAFRESMKLSLATLPGAVIGAVASLQLGDEMFQKILAVVMIGVVISMFISPVGGNSAQGGARSRLWLHGCLFLIGFYGGFIQVGVGFLFMAALYHIGRLDLVRVNMHKVFIVLIYTVPALIVFVVNDKVDWMLGAIVGLGSAVGAWWGAHVSAKKGEDAIRVVLVAAILLMALKLLGVV